ncbi:hypothetical protein ABH926_009656 [Catenulispora sp. GP43]|uniref:hypothetical protein n=1 Tax=Catenulispora sp. GP43 TaxID=3156263 RepID=UPI003517257D
MMNSETTGPTFQTGMIRTGAALIGGGLMLAAAGSAMAAIAVMRGVAAWARQREVSPTALAAGRFDQVRHATVAGAHAWREHAASTNGNRTPAR